MTLAVLVICTTLFLLLNYAPTVVPIDVVAPSGPRLWHGAVWGLLTSAFVHLQVWHVGFNMWWTRDLGRLMEPKLGRTRFAAFIVTSALVSSGWQLLVSGATGIGFSGVVYALFGFVASRRSRDPEYAGFATPRTTRWMLGWLVLCIVLTVAKVWTVGNAAHVSGLVFGWLVGVYGATPRWKLVARSVLALLGLGTILSAVYMPWSEAWRVRKILFYYGDVAARAAAGDAQAQGEAGALYVHYAERREEGIALLQRSAEAGNPFGMNNLAWLRATSMDASLRSADDAVHWATLAEAREPSASYTDTLAAAYAEAQRWDEALATEKKAMERLPPGPSELRTSTERHLALIENHQAIRE
ncbi:MAG: rhomboid family intramembrane serine protease [Polyangiaceae bacterium]|nr:rhomboid family intramembrane serine protease [Polyangiaceae bacterium]